MNKKNSHSEKKRWNFWMNERMKDKIKNKREEMFLTVAWIKK